MSAIRGVLAVATPLAPWVAGSPRAGLVPLTVGYALIAVTAEVLRRTAHGAAVRMAAPIAVLDGAFVVCGIAATGGPTGPLGAEVYLLVGATAVLVSPGTGFGVALWCAFLLAGARAGEDLAWWSLPGRIGDRAVVVAALSYVVVAVGIAVAHLVSEGGLRRRGERAAAFAELRTVFDDTEHDDGLAVALAGYVRDTLGFRRAVAVVRGRDLWHGATADESDGLPFALDAPLGTTASLALERAEPHLVRSLDAGLLTEMLPNASNVVLVPVVGERGSLGMVAAEWGGGARDRVPLTTVRALEAAATHVARALDRQARIDEMARQATRDPVTGLPNRWVFEESLEREVRRAERAGAPLSLIVLDVDHFKSVNDTAGHRAGDEVLRQVGTALVSMTKGFDLAARYGGDEFVVLLPGCPRSAVAGVAERLRAAASTAVTGMLVTLSAGAATLPDDAVNGEVLVAAADSSLYAAKHDGRDRTAVPSA